MATCEEISASVSDENPSRLRMFSGAFYIPKERVSKPEGEDAHFICVERQTIGVADGVGGWNHKGVDAGLYARELVSRTLDAISRASANEAIDPKKVLAQAYSETKADGSSTACILTLANNHLHAANVGDSGFLLIRRRQVFFRSPIQQSHFNCPYQLGKSSGNTDQAQIFKIAVREGDVIVVGTDGLFDNLFDHQIVDIVQMVAEIGRMDPEQAAWAVAEHAYYNSIDLVAPTPYSVGASAAGRVERSGGKKDDITVVISYIL